MLPERRDGQSYPEAAANRVDHWLHLAAFPENATDYDKKRFFRTISLGSLSLGTAAFANEVFGSGDTLMLAAGLGLLSFGTGLKSHIIDNNYQT